MGYSRTATRQSILAGALLLATACSSDSPTTSPTAQPPSTQPPTSSTPPPTTIEPPETTNTTEDPEAAVLEALAGYNMAFSLAANPPNPDAPELLLYATGPLLSRVRDLYAGYRDAGYRGEGQFVYKVESVAFESDDRVRVEQCGLDGNAIFDAHGLPVVTPDGKSYLYFSILIRIETTWKVSEEGFLGPLAQPCSLG